MGIFAAAALAGFLLFGWFKASPEVRDCFLKPWVQGLLGLIAFVVLVRSVWVLITLPTLEAVQIAQALTGPEVVQLILGTVFGCLLRYWWPQFWVIQMPPGTRYNWVAISLIGLLLLAAAAPYIGSLLRDWGMTGLKTPVAEFQFAGRTTSRVNTYIFEKQLATIEKQVSGGAPPYPATHLYIQPDIDYLTRFPNSNSKKRIKIYEKSLKFGKRFLDSLNLCARQAYNNYLDIESIRHTLSPVAQQLRLLIQAEPSQNSASEKKPPDPLRKEVEKSLDLLKDAIGKEKEKCTLNFSEERRKKKKKKEEEKKEKLFADLSFLAKTPHIYHALALLDEYNDNREGGISILKSAFKRFGDDRDNGPWILFNINFTLGLFLDASKHDPESIFPYFDRALEIAQDTLIKIDKRKRALAEKREQTPVSHDQVQTHNNQEILNNLKKLFEFAETHAKNALAYVSAEKRIRKFRALQYAKQNYDDLKELEGLMKPKIIDTYGYAKMAFAVRKVPTDIDEIERAIALFKEARSYIKIAPEPDRDAIEVKHSSNKIVRSHLEQANMLLEYQ